VPNAIIISEGPADDVFLKKLIEARAIPNWDVVPPRNNEAYGQGGFQHRLEGLKFKAGIEQNKAIVILADNDEDPTAAFKYIQGQIRDAGDYNVPQNPYQLSERGPFPPVAVIMLPAKDEQGSLDTLCLSATNPKYTDQLRCVNEIVNCVGATEHNCGKIQLAKLKVQCLLSTICRGDPYTPLKFAWAIEAAKGRPGDIFPLTNPAFDSLADFLQGIANLD
jgi:Protein of unknown function (DUF3226)